MVMSMNEVRRGPRKFYKGRYFIVFYDKTDEVLEHMFDNVREILKFQKKEITRQNVNLINVELYRALRTKEHITKFLTGEVMRVYIIEREEIDDE